MRSTESATLRHPAFVAVTAVQFMIVVVSGSTTMALPAVKDGLGAGDAGLQWFAALFALAYSVVLVIGGRLGDLRGTRRLLLLGFGGYVAALALAAFAPDLPVLLGARVLQGLSAGLMAPQLSAVIQRTYSGHARTRAFAVYLTAFVVASICVFTFPLGALALVVLGVLSLAFVALGRDVLQALERWLSRGALRAGRCPACRMGPVEAAGSPVAWNCRGCSARFEADGSQVQALEAAPEADGEAARLRVA